MRRANGITPPNPETPTWVNLMKSSPGPGVAEGGASFTVSWPLPALFSSPLDEPRRTPSQDAENPDGCTPGSSKYWNARAFPALRAGLRRIAARAWRKSGAAYAGERAAAGRDAAPNAPG